MMLAQILMRDKIFIKAKLVLVYETRDFSGKPIDQPSLTIDEAEKQVRLIRPTADASPSVGGISSAPKNFPSDGAFSDQDSMVFHPLSTFQSLF